MEPPSTYNGAHTSFRGLPEEVIVRVLHYCTYRGITRFATTCKRSLSIVSNSTSLQLHVELELNGLEVVNGSSKSDTMYSVILEELRRYRDAWLDFDLCPSVERPMGRQHMKLWELREGVFVKAFARASSQSQSPSDTLQFAPLDSPKLPSPVQFKYPFHDFTLDLGQELVVLVNVDGERSTCARIYLNSATTGLPHSLALHPVLSVQLEFSITHSQPSGIVLDITGDTLLVKFAHLKSQFYEILIWNWRLGVLLNRVSSRAGVCDFAFLDRKRLILYAAYPGSDNDSDLHSISLVVYNNIDSSSINHDKSLITDATFDVSSYPALEPVFIFQLPKLDPSMSVVQSRFSLRSDPTPGHTIYTSSASFTCSNAGTLGLSLSLTYNMHVAPHFVSYRIFVSASQLLDHLEGHHDGGVTTLPWDAWGESATRWFVESDDSHRNDWISWLSAGRYIRAMTDQERGSVNLSLVDFCTPRVQRYSSRIVDSYVDIPPVPFTTIRGRATTFEHRWTSAQRSLRSQLEQPAEDEVLVDVVGSHIPTTVILGLEKAVVSRLPYRTVTRLRPAPLGKAWLIDGSHIIGSDFQSRSGPRQPTMTVFKLQTSHEAPA